MLSLPKHLYRFVATTLIINVVEMLRQAQHDDQLLSFSNSGTNLLNTKGLLRGQPQCLLHFLRARWQVKDLVHHGEILRVTNVLVAILGQCDARFI